MSAKELDRAEIFIKLQQKSISQRQAADTLNISVRQVKRLFREYKKTGARALISRKRGKPGNHRLPEAVKALALALVQEHYPDFGPTFAHEKLEEVHKIKISVTTLRNVMITAGIWVDKKVKRKRVYQLRERRSREGELVQMDGSPHDWFEGRGPKCSLLLCVDDATGKIQAALFAPSEALFPYYTLMKLYLKKHGRPVSFYTDKHATFKVNRLEALTGEGITQFGRGMKELDIKLIYANSAPAKGRIERTNQTMQDRLVKELRLNKISSIEEANAFLPSFMEDYNRRFAVVPKDPTNAHRPILQEHDLDLIFTIQEFRYLSKNLTFQYKNTIFQIITERESYALRKARVTVREKEDGSIEVLYKGKSLSFTTYNYQERQGEVVDSKRLNEVIDTLQKTLAGGEQKPRRKPVSKNHPWKRGRRRSLVASSSLFSWA